MLHGARWTKGAGWRTRRAADGAAYLPHHRRSPERGSSEHALGGFRDGATAGDPPQLNAAHPSPSSHCSMQCSLPAALHVRDFIQPDVEAAPNSGIGSTGAADECDEHAVRAWGAIVTIRQSDEPRLVVTTRVTPQGLSCGLYVGNCTVKPRLRSDRNQ